MARLEDLTTGTRVTGLTASGSVTAESAQWIGEQGLKVIYRDADGGLGERFVYREELGLGADRSANDAELSKLRSILDAPRHHYFDSGWLFHFKDSYST